MLVMVIERFRHGAAPVFARARERGRQIPDGLRYIDSWVDAAGMERCWQLMECDDPALLDAWASAWADLVDFEFVPVTGSREAAARAMGDA